jgi:predicted MFS family arabinose efflux permease
MSLSREYLFLSVSYFVTGLGSGAAFIGSMSLPSLWFHPSHRARGAGVVTAGAGIGILYSGLAVPRTGAGFGLMPWQMVWLSFAVLAVLFCLLAAWLLRERPADIGLSPYGRKDDGATPVGPAAARITRHWPVLLHLGVIYSLFAATGLTYTTFIVTTMVDELAVAAAAAGILWALVGGLSIFSGTLFGSVSDRMGHRAGMISALFVQAVAYGLIAAGTGMPGLYASIILFGLSAWSMPSIVAAASGDYLGPERAAAGFAILTLMFAVGQALGPAGAGILAGWTGGFAAGYGIAAGLNLLAVFLCFFLRPPARA